MISLREYLKFAGLVSAEKLHLVFGQGMDWEEFGGMIEDREVSVHIEAFGLKQYRYPFHEPRDKRESNDGPSLILKLVKKTPGVNAKFIRGALKISQTSFEKWEADLLRDGSLVREKKGQAWLYSMNPEGPEFKPTTSDERMLWNVFVECQCHASVREAAESCKISRDSVIKYKKELVQKGLMDESGEVNFPKSPVERRKFLEEHFPFLDEQEMKHSSLPDKKPGVRSSSLTESQQNLVDIIKVNPDIRPPQLMEKLHIEEESRLQVYKDLRYLYDKKYVKRRQEGENLYYSLGFPV